MPAWTQWEFCGFNEIQNDGRNKESKWTQSIDRLSPKYWCFEKSLVYFSKHCCGPTPGLNPNTMKKRLRKKKHIGEFAAFGVPVAAKLIDGTDFDSFLDTFLEDAIEANCCYFGGGGQKDRLSGIIELGRKNDLPEEKLKKVSYWFRSNGNVANHMVGEIDDLWYEPFDDLDTIAEKI